MDRLGKQTEGAGYCHFPKGGTEDNYKQLTAEKLVTRYVNGFPVREWLKGDKERNEALDCRVYAYSALKIMNPSLSRLARRMDDEMKRMRGAARTAVDVTPIEQPAPVPAVEPDKPLPQWAQAAANSIGNNAAKLAEALVALREASAAVKPQEEPKAPEQQTRRIRRSHALKSRKGGGYVRNY
jgi:phage terminase large subunit GpA-like protein